jgi:hypothetical protein
MLKTCHRFYCKKCDYGTSKKSSYDNHLLTAKHKNLCLVNEMEINGNKNTQKTQKNPLLFVCSKCNKKYNTNSGLWKHKNNCKIICNENNIIDNNVPDKDYIMLLIKQNTELLEIIKNGTHNNINTTNNNTNSNNKTFNLQFFLNETCKDAMNIMDFVDSVKLQLSDLEKLGEIGYVDGISNIIVKNLKALDIDKRPVHCTDAKREVLYIKDDDKWEKENEDKNKLRKVIKKIANRNSRMLNAFKEKHPDCGKSDSLFSDQYNKLIIEAMGGSGDNDLEKEDKIIRKITKEVTINKEMY